MEEMLDEVGEFRVVAGSNDGGRDAARDFEGERRSG